MVKLSSKNGRKDHKGLESKDLSSTWEKEIAPLGRRLTSVAKSLLVSIFKLLVASVLILVGYCRRALIAVGQLIRNAWLWIYNGFVGVCRRVFDAAKRRSSGLKMRLDLGLIVGVVLSVLIITYLVPSKYKSFNPLNSPSIALGGMNLGGVTPNNSPPLALISYSSKPKRGASQTCCPKKYSFWPKRITLRHVEGWGEGISFGTDYSTLALLFAPDYRVGRIMPMLDLRGHRFDNNTYAANIGIAARYVPGSNNCCPNKFCQILGFNVFWDWREGRLGSFQQIGAGLEVLGTRWDLRANVYAPISVKKRRRTCRFDYEGGFFAVHRRCEFTSYGYNAEIGYYVIRGCDFFLYAAVGPYYLVRKCHDNTRGGEFRLRPQYKDYLALDFSVSYDNVFKTVYQAQVIFYLPLYQLSKCLNKRPCCLSDQQIYQPIERFEVMPLGRRSCWQRNF